MMGLRGKSKVYHRFHVFYPAKGIIFPFYKLRKLHEAIAFDTPRPIKGYLSSGAQRRLCSIVGNMIGARFFRGAGLAMEGGAYPLPRHFQGLDDDRRVLTPLTLYPVDEILETLAVPAAIVREVVHDGEDEQLNRIANELLSHIP